MTKTSMPPSRRLHAGTPELEVAGLIDSLTSSRNDVRVLVALMRERHPLYAGRGTNATIRIRGYAMAAFERVGLPDDALLFVIEELETGQDPYLVASAARALRGLDTRERRVVPFLFRAIANVRDRDDMLTFETYLPTWPVARATTALAEIFETFAWLGPNAAFALPRLAAFDAEAGGYPAVTRAALTRAVAAVQANTDTEDPACCGPSPAVDFGNLGRTDAIPAGSEPPLAARFEDESGRTMTYGELFTGRPTVVVFFYTRCTNPNKCSLTITKLGRLQRTIVDGPLAGAIRTAAITYDPDFDLPGRLLAYGENRGVVFDDDHRLLRATTGFRAVAEYFELGVNYGPAVVNRHRIEAFVLDDTGRISSSFTRLPWDVREVLDRAVGLRPPPMGVQPVGGVR